MSSRLFHNTWRLFVAISLICYSVEALSVSRHSKAIVESQKSEQKLHWIYNEQNLSTKREFIDSVALSRRNVFRKAGIASAVIFTLSMSSANTLPAQAADTLDGYLVSLS